MDTSRMTRDSAGALRRELGLARPGRDCVDLIRAGGALASALHSKATTAVFRRQLVSVADRVTRSDRRSTLRLLTTLALG